MGRDDASVHNGRGNAPLGLGLRREAAGRYDGALSPGPGFAAAKYNRDAALESGRLHAVRRRRAQAALPAVSRRAVGRRPVCARQARSCLGYGARGCGAGRLCGIARMPARAAHAQDLPQVRRA